MTGHIHDYTDKVFKGIDAAQATCFEAFNKCRDDIVAAEEAFHAEADAAMQRLGATFVTREQELERSQLLADACDLGSLKTALAEVSTQCHRSTFV